MYTRLLRLVSSEYTKYMAQHVSAEQRAKILSSIKDEGVSITEAAKQFLITEDTIKKWMRKQSKNGHTSSTEVQRLKQENQFLKIIIGDMILEKKKKGSFHSS
jgi:transposase-like protein